MLLNYLKQRRKAAQQPAASESQGNIQRSAYAHPAGQWTGEEAHSDEPISYLTTPTSTLAPPQSTPFDILYRSRHN